MRDFYLLLSLLVSFIFGFTFISDAQIVNIPDPIFKNFLLNHSYSTNPSGIGTTIYLDANGDNEIQYSEAENYPGNVINQGFFMSNLGISDLTGIEAFQNIKKLYIGNNNITFLNLDECGSLEYVNCAFNPLTSIVIDNPSLRELYADQCLELVNIDVHLSQNLRILNCHSNPLLTSLNLMGCWFLQELRVNFNPNLTEIDFGFYYYDSLTLFQCSENALTSLDLSGCTALSNFYCTGNQLVSLNLANGQMNSFQQIFVNGYPDLFCVQVDNVAAADFLWGNGYPFVFDSWVTFTTDCTNFNPNPECVITIPDVNFKNALLADAAINTNGNNEIECTEAASYDGDIHVDNLNISDLTGIEAFVHIHALSCSNQQTSFGGSGNYLEEVNVSGLSELTSINCTGNVGLMALDASGCAALTELNVTGRHISLGGFSLNLSNCSSLVSLDLNDKFLVGLNVAGCSGLERLDCSENSIPNLNLDACSGLTTLLCQNNELTALNTFSNALLDTLNCANNYLNYLVVSLNSNLTHLNCSYNNISYLDLYNNGQLINVDCSHNSINNLSVNNNHDLLALNCGHNNLSNLSVNNDENLETLYCDLNLLTNIDVSENLSLRTLDCGENQLSNLDLSANLNLQNLNCDNNLFAALDLSHNKELLSFDCSENDLSTLDLLVNTKLVILDCSDNVLETLTFRNDTALYYFNVICSNNFLSELDFSNTFLHLLECSNNNLEILNLANGNNLAPYFSAYVAGNPLLSCVQVDDAEYSETNWHESILFSFDEVVSFSENCAGILNPVYGIDEVVSCGEYTWIDGETYSADNTTATFVFVAGGYLGNDSIVTLNLTIHPIPNPEVVFEDGILSTQEYQSYQWFLDGFSIDGANEQTFVPEESGNYSVFVIDINGCEHESESYEFVQSGIQEVWRDEVIRFYPNPTQGFIQFSRSVNGTVKNSIGEEVMKMRNVSSVDISSLAAGLYIVDFTNAQGERVGVARVLKE